MSPLQTAGRFRTFTFVSLALLSLAVAAIRIFSYSEPPEWDIATYLVVGHELNHGEQLYADVWDSKPPAIFTTFALAERISGYGQEQIYLLSVVAAIVTLLGIYRAASVESRAAGLWAAVLWTCVCFDPLLGANLPNTEVFINAALTWTLAIMLHMDLAPRPLRSIVLAGCLLGIASLYKQVAIAPAVLLAVAHVYKPPVRVRRRTAMVHAMVMLVIGVAIWAVVVVYFAVTSRGWLFVQTNFVHAGRYSGDLLKNFALGLAPSHLFPECMRNSAPLAVGVLLLVFLRRKRDRTATLLVAAAGGAFLAIAWPGRFFDHYYQLWLPVFVIAAAWSIDALKQFPTRWLSPLFGATLVATLIVPQFSWFALSGEHWAERKHSGFFWRALSDADDIARVIGPADTFFAWTDEAWIYYRLRHRPPAVALWKTHTLEGPLADWLSRRTAEQLQHDRPQWFIDWQNIAAPADHPVAKFLVENYESYDDGKTRWPFKLYVLRDGSQKSR